MTCLLRGPDQGSHGNWQAQHPSSTGAVHCNIRKRTYSQTLLTAVCMFEHAVQSIKHISMALYRFQKAAGCICIILIVRNLRTKSSGLLQLALARAYWQLVLFRLRFALLMSRANSTA